MAPTDPPLAELRTRVVAALRRRGLGEHDAQDCAQDVFVSLHRSLRAKPEHPAPEALALAIARTAYVDWIRGHQRRQRALLVAVEEQAAGCVNAVHVDPSIAIDMRAAVASLPERLRVVVELSVRRGLSYPEISAALDIPVGTVKSRMHTAMKRLRARLGEVNG